MNVVSFATAAVPSVPPRPSGSSAYTAAQNSADERSAFGVSRSVSWNSGANVATTSIPYADQHMKSSQTSKSARPPPDPPDPERGAPPRADRPRHVRARPVTGEIRQEHERERRDAEQSAGDIAEPDRRTDAEDVEQPDE